MAQSISDTTQLVLRLGQGESGAAGRLLSLVYDELRQLAASHMRRERADHTLQPTALVHEVFLRLIDTESVEWRGRAHFMALAAEQIRRILVDHARRHRAAKRGGRLRRTTLTGKLLGGSTDNLDVLDLHDGMVALADRAPRQSRVVELRFFGGLEFSEVAEVIGVSERTVKGDWRAARAWLRLFLEPR